MRRRRWSALAGVVLVLAGTVTVVAAAAPAAAVDPSQWGLTSYCTPAEDFPESRRFRVRNNSGSTEQVVLRNQSAGLSVSYTATPGDSFALVPAASDPNSANTTQLIVEGVTVATKAANNKGCSSLVGSAVCNPAAGAFTVTWTMKNNDTGSSSITASSLPLTFAPNPVPPNGSSTATESVAGPATGSVVRTLTLTVNLGSGVVSNPTASVTLGQCQPPPPPVIDFTFTKTPSVTDAAVGDTVTYTYSGENTGEVALEVTQLVDDRLGIVIQEPATTIVPPGGSLTRTVDYVVTATDGAIGLIANSAVVTVVPQSGPDQEPRTAVADAEVTVDPPPTPPDVALVGAAVCDPETGIYDIGWILYNGGPGNAIVVSTAPRTLTFDPAVIAPDEVAVATETAAAPTTGVTVLTLSVNVDTAPGAPIPRGPGSATATVTLSSCEEPLPPVIDLAFTKTADRTVAPTGDVVTYTYEVTNTGEVPLELTQLVDDRLGVVLQPPEELVVEPGESGSRQVTYTVVPQDASFGSIDNAAVLSARLTGDPESPTFGLVAEASVAVPAIPTAPDPPQGGVLAESGAGSATGLAMTGLGLLVVGGLLLRLARAVR